LVSLLMVMEWWALASLLVMMERWGCSSARPFGPHGAVFVDEIGFAGRGRG
jgi:hypothetical protein